MAHSNTTFNQAVAEAVTKGLSAEPKSLPSWLFYDENGDGIFRQIMRTPEYYPTRCEYDILQKHKDQLLKHFTRDHPAFQLIELGAGDGLKTEILLQHFVANNTDFTYLPVDISANALDNLTKRLTLAMPQLRIQPQNKTYDESLVGLRNPDEKKVILFMGAGIGNFPIHEAVQFLKKLVLPLSKKDLLLIGFDLKKDPRIILEAYDDPRGLTASFNRNVLLRLNRELGAAFNPDYFSHYPTYDPEIGTTKSFLISTKDQVVYIETLQRSFHFDRWESVQTEVSQKYDIRMIEKLMSLTGLETIDFFFDSDEYFCDVLVNTG